MIISIILFLVIFLNIILGFYVLFKNLKASNNRLFFIMCVIASMWAFTNYMTNTHASLFWYQSSYAFGSLVISTGLVWTFFITQNKLNKNKLIIIYIIALFFSVLSYKPHFIDLDSQFLISFILQRNSYDWMLILYSLYYFTLAFIIISKLYSYYKSIPITNKTLKYQIKYILIGAIIALCSTALNSFIFPYFSILIPGNIDSLGFLFFISFITYAITRHKLFNIKIITAEFIVFGLWIFMLIRIFAARTPHDFILESVVLFVTTAFGIMLIRSILLEVKQRKMIEKLTSDLDAAYMKIGELSNILQ